MKLVSNSVSRQRLLLGLGAVACASATLSFAKEDRLFNVEPSGPAALSQAHAAYLQGDFLTVTTSIRDVLADKDADTEDRANALELLAAAEKEARGKLPADWSLPEGVFDMKISQTRKQQPSGIAFELQMRANMVEPDTVSQVQLVKYPDTIVLDKAAGVGSYEVAEEDDGFYSFDFEAANQDAPHADGLYLIRLELKNGTKADGWFILSDLASSASPMVHSPSVGQTFSTANPTFAWDDFRSPEYKPYERRRFGLYVVKVTDTAPYWERGWDLYTSDPTLTQTVVGIDERGGGLSALPDGEYWTAVTYVEERRFGPIRLRRASRTARGIYINVE